MSRIHMSILMFAAFAGFSHGVRAYDELERAIARQAVAKQKLTAEVSDAISRSRKLEKTELADARALLERTLQRVKDSQDILLDSERAPLVRQLQTRLGELNEAVRQRRIEQEAKNAGITERPKRPTESSSGVNGGAKNFIDGVKGAQGSTQSTVRDREKAITKIANRSLDMAMVSDEPIQFPKYWAKLTEERKKMFGPKLTETEVKVLKTLNSTISVEYKADEFQAVLNHLQEKTGLSLIMDEASMQDLNLDYKDPVTVSFKKVTVRTALKKILGDKGLTYIIKEGALQVMTPKKASEYTVIRSYPIDGLVAPNQMAMMFGPFVARQAMLNNAQQIVNLIQSTVEPSYWQPNGPGVIVFDEITKSLMIRASAEMHYSIPSMIGR